MINKKILFNIYISILSIYILFLIIFFILGNKPRIGYLSDFNLNIDRTLELNGLDINETKKTLSINNKLDEITNYIFTNRSITNYSYGFRIKYYSKIFRNSDIYRVYIDINEAIRDNDFIKEINMDVNGSPFGNIITSKNLINIKKIDDIEYYLKLRNIFPLMIFILILIFALLNLSKIKKLYNKKTIIIIAVLTILIIITTSFLGKINRISHLSEFKLISSNNGEYTYSFKIEHNSKIFKNNYIYDIYYNLNNLPNYIKSAKINDKFGYLISYKELLYNDKINIEYYLIINFNLFYNIAIIFIIFLLILGFYILKEYWKYKNTLNNYDHLFINKIEFIAVLLFCFQYWLYYPGYFQYYDTWRSIVHGLYNTGYNWDPVLVDLEIKFIDKIGLTMGVFLFINLFLWYSSISLIIITLYIRFKNKLIILLFIISFISQIYFYNVQYLKDFVSTLYVIFSYSIILIIIISKLNKYRTALKCISLIALIIGMLHRHNFIVTIYPIFIWFTYDFLKSKNIKNMKKYSFYFISIMIINAIILIGIYFIFPRIFVKDANNTATYHVYYLQIAGCIVPANDSSLIPENWWGKDKNFEDLVKQYNDNPSYGDPIRNDGIIVVSPNKIKEIKEVWIKSILKYPINYIKHMLNYTKDICFPKYYKINLENNYPNSLVLKNNNVYETFINSKFFKDNNGIKFTELKRNINNFLYNYLPEIKVFIFIIISLILFIISGILFILKKEFRNDILIFTFSSSFSSFSTFIIVVLFTPLSEYRYIYPTIPISILSLISFISFIYYIGELKDKK